MKKISIPIKVLLTSSFLMNLGGFAVYAFLTVYLTSTLRLSPFQVGTILTANVLVQRGLPLITGMIGDRTSHVYMIILGYFFRGLGFFGYALFDTFGWLVVSSVLAGFGGALFGPSVTAVFASLPEEEQKHIFPIYNMFLNLGVVAGPIVAGILGDFHPKYPFFWAGGVFMIMTLLVFSFRKRYQTTRMQTSPLQSLNQIIHHRSFIYFFLVMILYWCMWQQLMVSLPIQVFKVNGSEKDVSFLLTISGLAGFFWMMILKNQFRQYASLDMVQVGVITLGISLALVPWVPETLWIYFCVVLFMLGETMVFPGSKLATSEYSNQQNTGAYFGLYEMAWGIGGAIGNYMGSFLMSEWGDTTLPWQIYGGIGVLAYLSIIGLKKLTMISDRP